VTLDPAPILAVLVGCFHTGLFFFIFGRGGLRIVLTVVAASLGAWAGDAVGGRLAIDPLRLGDFHLLAASVVAWLGIVFVEVLSILGPGPAETER
jgi:hypothetical protein